ncbi:MAG: hypothetical protein R2712_05340 [Vicinamibacterales bacterium]
MMVVDDDEGIRDLIVSYFQTQGVRVTAATDGRAATVELQRSGAATAW